MYSIKLFSSLFFLLILIKLESTSSFFVNYRPINYKFDSKFKMSLKDDPLELSDENAIIVIDEIKKELGTIFGYDKGSRDVGITGK